MSRMTGHAYLRHLERGQEQEVPLDDFDAVFRRYASYVSTVLYRVMGSREDVEDMVQDVFIEAFKSLHRLENPAAIKRYLAVIAVRRVHKKLRKKRIKVFFGFGHDESFPEQIAPGATPEQKALLRQLFKALDRIPVDERLAWTLRHVEGMTISEVSEILECSVSTTKRRIARAEERLNKVMGHE